MNIKRIRELFYQELKEVYPEREISSFVRIIAGHLLGWSYAEYHLNLEMELPDKQSDSFFMMMEGLKMGKPIQYLTGIAPFGDLTFYVGPGVLIPRPETEELCMLAANEAPLLPSDASVLDVGTGSGCIAIWIKNRFPSFRVTALDNSEIALKIARENALNHKLDIDFVNANILDPEKLLPGRIFDIIVSNPPYIPGAEMHHMHINVVDHEPHEALFTPDDDPLIFYRAIARLGKQHLSPTGIILMEIHEQQGKTVRSLFLRHGYSQASIYLDIHGKHRFVKVHHLLQQGD